MKKNKKKKKTFLEKDIFKMHFGIFFMILAFSIFGIVMIFSASNVAATLRYGLSYTHFFNKQILYIVVGFILGFLVILKIPLKNYNFLIWPGIIACVVMLVGLFPYGKISNGAQSWYDLGFMNLQPSEATKAVLIVFFAYFYQQMCRAKSNNVKYNIKDYRFYVPLAIGAVITLLIAMQPDLGGAIIIMFLSYLLFMAAPIGKGFKRIITLAGVGLVALFGVTYFVTDGEILSTYQRSRFEFRNPCERYLEQTGYQVCNGFIALNNGGLFGVGLGNSSQKYLYLSDSHTDFIFPIIVEELGLIVGIVVILAYIALLLLIFKVARTSYCVRNAMIAYGVFVLLLLHILVNLMGILALIPLTGVPLPFLSYGGSFNLTIISLLFLVLRVSIENKKYRELKIKE